MTQDATKYRVFLSHGSADSWVATRMKENIETSGAFVFIDSGEIKFGDDFRGRVLDELKRCDELVVLVTVSSLQRPWVLAEIGASLIREKRIIAVCWGVEEATLEATGFLSLLGPNLLCPLDELDKYVRQLRNRVEGTHGT